MNLHWRAPAGLHTSSLRLPVEGELPSLDGATGWLSSPPLTAAGLRGKVVLTGFWTCTCTCINWRVYARRAAAAVAGGRRAVRLRSGEAVVEPPEAVAGHG